MIVDISVDELHDVGANKGCLRTEIRVRVVVGDMAQILHIDEHFANFRIGWGNLRSIVRLEH